MFEGYETGTIRRAGNPITHTACWLWQAGMGNGARKDIGASRRAGKQEIGQGLFYCHSSARCPPADDR